MRRGAQQSHRMIILAGKNNIAVAGLELLCSRYDTDQLAIVCNRTDTGTDGWQRSLRVAGQKKRVREITLEEAYGFSDAFFLSLEFDRLVDPRHFAPRSVVNIHFSALPAHKGMFTSIWPILWGEASSGVTFHEIDPGIDTGDIISQRTFAIDPSWRSRDLYHAYISNGITLFEQTADALLTDSFTSRAQGAERSTYHSRKSIDFGRCEVSFFQTAWQVQRYVYAFSFREYQLPTVRGVAVVEVELLAKKSRAKPGSILRESAASCDVATIDYDVRVFPDLLEQVLAACARGDVPFVAAHLKNLAGLNDKNARGWSPLIVAAYHNHHAIVKLLLEAGADPNDVGFKGTSALMYAKDGALRDREPSTFRLLLDNGASLSHADHSGKTLFEYVDGQARRLLGI